MGFIRGDRSNVSFRTSRGGFFPSSIFRSITHTAWERERETDWGLDFTLAVKKVPRVRVWSVCVIPSSLGAVLKINIFGKGEIEKKWFR